jgi:NAD(P)-dependent dehydrogenase (short-subunit alcohol dehydrogenase family)
MTERSLPREFPEQQQKEPGHETQMEPKPEVIRASYRGSGKLKDKVAFITGGDSGIGRSVAVHFAREGCDVAINYLPEEEDDAQITRQMVEQEGRKCLLVPGDIRDRNFCSWAIKKTVQQLGKLNILVNNAAEQHPVEDFRNIDLDVMEKTFRTNIFAMFYLTKEALHHLKPGDSIINSTSVTNYRGHQDLVDYSSTKGAITAFTRSLGKNLAEGGIRVNAVAPGPIWTPLIPSTFTPEHVKEFGRNTPMGRAGQPSEVAPAYVFLASEDASYVTSQVIHPNGGEVVNA